MTTRPLTPERAEQLMAPFLQLIEYSTKFTDPVNLDGFHWMFDTKKPIQEEPHWDRGNIASFTMGWDSLHDACYVVYNNSGDDKICQGLRDFIDYISVK